MVKVERVREAVVGVPSNEYWSERSADGWRLVSVEWERDLGVESCGESGTKIEPPYGLRVAPDCRHLESHPDEREVLATMLEHIRDDTSLSEVAHALNQRGFRTRSGSEWTQVGVFDMLPRLIDAAPDLQARQGPQAPQGQHGSRVDESAGQPRG